MPAGRCVLNNKVLYHITNYKNFKNILRDGKILCKNKIDIAGTNYINIAYEGIQDRRSRKEVPLPPFGNLHDYVPFYFAPRSPMLYAIHKGNVDGYIEGQESIIYLIVNMLNILATGCRFVYTDGHPIVMISDFYNDIDQINTVIDWDLMKSKYWSDIEEDNDRKRRRQAEFLIYQSVSIKLLDQIIVYNLTMKNKIKQLLSNYNYKIPVISKKELYY